MTDEAFTSRLLTCRYSVQLVFHISTNKMNHFTNFTIQHQNRGFISISSKGYESFWHERAAYQRSEFGRSTAGNDVVATTIISLFSFFPPIFFSVSSVATFSHRRSARIKKLIQRKLLRTLQNLEIDTFPDPVGHFGAPWRPFWILQAVRRCRR